MCRPTRNLCRWSEESLDPLKQQGLQQAGSDAYNEVVASHQPYTFTSSVRQMKSNLILLLRRLWRFPFGSGTIRSLSDMWAHYITRLQGSKPTASRLVLTNSLTYHQHRYS